MAWLVVMAATGVDPAPENRVQQTLVTNGSRLSFSDETLQLEKTAIAGEKTQAFASRFFDKHLTGL
ncbi:hypothetical protein ACQKQA_15565 [Pseudomonas sp. NPDC089530]|uniref:hypothetical protein n=1 Tax=Pseudomonas sp. NPDC089530 TaxID=3390651 RepID=UPI003D089D4A